MLGDSFEYHSIHSFARWSSQIDIIFYALRLQYAFHSNETRSTASWTYFKVYLKAHVYVYASPLAMHVHVRIQA